jgi:serine/threonine protein kinase
VYGLASTLYQLLAGQAPFAAYEGETPASVILRILRDPVTPLRAKADVPIALSDLLSTALAKDPGRRPVSALALAEALQQIEALEGWPPTFPAVWGQATAAVPIPAPQVPLPASLLEEPESPPSPAATIAPLPPPPVLDPADRGPAVVKPANTQRRVLPPQPVGADIPPPADLLPPQPIAATTAGNSPAAPHAIDAPAAAPSGTFPRPQYVDPPSLPAAPRPLGPDYDDTLAPAGLAAAMQQTKRESPPAGDAAVGRARSARWWRRRRK